VKKNLSGAVEIWKARAKEPKTIEEGKEEEGSEIIKSGGVYLQILTKQPSPAAEEHTLRVRSPVCSQTIQNK